MILLQLVMTLLWLLALGYVTANLQVGEELTVEQLLYVLMVGSSNDAAIVLAEHVAGSQEEFSNLMNKKHKNLDVQIRILLIQMVYTMKIIILQLTI